MLKYVAFSIPLNRRSDNASAEVPKAENSGITTLKAFLVAPANSEGEFPEQALMLSFLGHPSRRDEVMCVIISTVQ